MKKIYIGFAFAHHKGTQGGYHHIKDYLKYDAIIDAQLEKEFFENPSSNVFFRVLRRLFIILFGQGTPLAILRCIIHGVFGKNRIFHFIYAENSYKWLHNFVGKRNKIICTFHQPASFFENKIDWLKKLKKIDGVILLTQNDVRQFEEWTGKNNVHFIPHGVNCSFYFFDKLVERRNSVLMVGNWLRDFELAKRVFHRLNREMPEININVVANKENHYYFKELNINCFSKISDQELRYLYQTASLVFFPLKQFTANNAVLEAASCGCEIIISTPIIPDFSYFSNQHINFTNDNFDIVYERIRNILLNTSSSKNSQISEYVRENFSWEKVAQKTDRVFNIINFNLENSSSKYGDGPN